MKSKFFRISAFVLILSFSLSMLAACNPQETHTHTYSDAYAYDEEYHWTTCECGENSAPEAHSGGKADCETKAICNKCGTAYGELAPHEYTKLHTDESTHWYECACGAVTEPESHDSSAVKYSNATRHWLKCSCGYEHPGAEHVLVDFICSGCGYKAPGWDHVHEFNVLRCDETGHWYECACMATSEKVAHTGGVATCTKRAECEVCTVAYGELMNHSYTSVRITEQYHTYVCDCGAAQEREEHSFTGGVCSCGYEKAAEGHVHSFSILKYNQASHWYECACKVAADVEAHTGGSSTCESKAVCEICSQSYGEIGHKWNDGELTTPNTVDTSGIITYTCAECAEKRCEIVPIGATVLTRADLEEALVSVAWAYYLKGEKFQYDSAALSVINNHYGGTCRHTREASPEYGTSDTTIYSVCTGYPTKVYIEALDRYIWEDVYSPNGVVTMWFWLAADNQSEEGFRDYYQYSTDPITENDRDTALVRWIDFEKYLELESEEVPYAYSLQTFESSAFGDWYKNGTLELRRDEGSDSYSYYLNGEMITAAQAKELLCEYITEQVDGEYINLRPGDLITEDTHTLLYVGNGIILDCNGYKYDINTGTDKAETASIRNRKTIEKTLMNDAVSDYVIVRPLDYYTKDYDGNPGNDIIKYQGESIEITEATKSRQQYPAMEIDRTVDITPYGTAAKNGTLTYSIKISNKTNEETYRKWRALSEKGYNGEAYRALSITEAIPSGTVFVSASEGYSINNGVLSWTVDIPAGKTVELTYTVKVTAEVGSTIVSDGGMVASIPSNSISNRVGYSKLTEEQISILESISESDVSEWKRKYGSDLAFSEYIYKALGVTLDLPTVEEIIENMFTPTCFEKQLAMTVYYQDKNEPITMYVPQENVSEEYAVIQKMLVDRYFGGYRMFSADLEKFKEQGVDNYDFPSELDEMILEFSFDYLEVGDILVYATAKNRGNTDLTSELASARVLIYVGNGTFIEMTTAGVGAVYSGEDAEKVLASSFEKTNDLFFLLRPSQVCEVADSND